MALIAWGAGYWGAAGADTNLARIGLGAGVSIIACCTVRLEAIVVADTGQASVLIHALRAGISTERPVRGMVRQADARVVAGIGEVASATRRITARRTGGLESVVMADTRKAGVLIHAGRTGITTERPVSGVVRQADARVVAGIG
jgi:hypothetical protein